VSLPSYIIQLFGSGSVPVLVAGSVYGVFELGERLASQRFKDDLSKWLLTFDVQKARALPDGTQELFERIFGERHFSLKCFVRSAAFSVGAMAFLSIVLLLINPLSFITSFSIIHERYEQGVRDLDVNLTTWWVAFLIFAGLWLLWSIVVDYISLFKTRVILKLLVWMHQKYIIATIATLAMDYLSYRALFFIGMMIVSVPWDLAIMGFYNQERSFSELWEAYFFQILPASREAVGFVMYWAGFAPSIWMWLYVFALFVTRGLLRSERIINSLRYFLDVEKAPLRSIGAVAATLAFIASVAIIFVSAEVSRISAAS